MQVLTTAPPHLPRRCAHVKIRTPPSRGASQTSRSTRSPRCCGRSSSWTAPKISSIRDPISSIRAAPSPPRTGPARAPSWAAGRPRRARQRRRPRRRPSVPRRRPWQWRPRQRPRRTIRIIRSCSSARCPCMQTLTTTRCRPRQWSAPACTCSPRRADPPFPTGTSQPRGRRAPWRAAACPHPTRRAP